MSWIRFVHHEVSPSGKTQIYNVVSSDGGHHLGQIKFFPRWRCYAFFPEESSVFEHRCLRDIAEFCVNETAKWRGR